MKIRDLTRITLFVSVIIICSYIMVPFPVPITMQTMGIFVCVLVLGKKRGTLAILIYILIGVIGIPVFSGMKGGIVVLLSPTGGYITGFLLCGYLTGLVFERTNKAVLSCTAGLVALYAVGTVWFYMVNPISVAGIVSTCILPFVIPDIFKILTAVYIKKVLR